MIQRYYDVVVLGTGLRGLLAGALVAKRGFRVLVLGQGHPSADYEAGGRRWPRRPYRFVAARSPIAQRVLADIALHQELRRRSQPLEPSFQVILPSQRLDVTTEPAFLASELDREFPTVKRALEDFHALTRREMAALDRALARPLVVPPETFFERRELARAVAGRRTGRDGQGPDPLGELSREHPFREVVATPAAFSVDLDPASLSTLGLLRAYGSWWLGATRLEGGYGWLEGALIAKIRAANGEVRASQRAESLEIRRGAVQGLELARTGERVGCRHLVETGSVEGLQTLLPHRGAELGELFARQGEPTPRRLRYVLHVLLRPEAVPEGLAPDAFLVGEAPGEVLGRLRLQLGPEDERHEGEPVRRLSVEVLLPARLGREPAALGRLRERVLAKLRRLLPFLDEHLILVDSPHDGRGVDDPRAAVERPASDPWSRGPDTMEAQYATPATGALGVAGLPLRTPLRGLLLAGPHAAPGLGEEGAFLTAWSAARLVDRGDRRRAFLRRPARFAKPTL